jgi:hypothetical protein
MNDFLWRAAALNLLPAWQYRTATFSLAEREPNLKALSSLGERSPQKLKERFSAVERYLDGGIEPVQSPAQAAGAALQRLGLRQRLSVVEALSLVENSTLGDLAMACEQRCFDVTFEDNSPPPVEVQLEGSFDPKTVANRILSSLDPRGDVLFSIGAGASEDCSRLEELLRVLRPATTGKLTALSIEAVTSMADRALHLRSLAAAGLDAIGGAGDYEQLLNACSGSSTHDATFSLLDELGVRISVELPLGGALDWPVLLNQLSHLRWWQEFHQLLADVRFEGPSAALGPKAAEARLRAEMVTRLFLDNVTYRPLYRLLEGISRHLRRKVLDFRRGAFPPPEPQHLHQVIRLRPPEPSGLPRD